MSVKNMLGDIQTDYDNLRHGPLPQVVLNTLHFGTSMPWGGIHPIINRRQFSNR
jgi:hypothetical protein